MSWLEGVRRQGVGDLERWLRADPARLRDALGLIRTLDVNRAAMEQAGAGHREELLGGFLPLITDSTLDDSIPELVALWNGETHFEFLTSSRAFDGTVRRILASVRVPLTDHRPDYSRVMVTGTDISDRERQEALAAGERRVLELIARGRPSAEVLTAICRFVEETCPALRASILVADPQGSTLHHGAAPSLPAELNRCVDGLPIREGVGACGTAASRRQPVLIPDAANDPSCAAFSDLVRRFRLNAIWSLPAIAPDGTLLGTIAVYFREARGPGADERQTVETCVPLVSIALERERANHALARSEARYRRLVEHCYDLIAELDESGVVRYASPKLPVALGWTVEELSGTPLFSLVHPDDAEHVLTEFRRPEAALGYRIRHRDGRWLRFESTARRYRTACGETRTVVISRDITARLAAEEALREARRMESLGVLAGGIAHDFNNILAAILGNTELSLHHPHLPPEVRDSLQQTTRAAHRARELVLQILTFSRQRETCRVPLQMADVVREATSLLRASLPPTIRIEEQFHEDLPRILGEASQIHQIILNLGANAAHAMRAGGGTLRITLAADILSHARAAALRDGFPAGRCVCLTVSDTGHGMTPDVLSRVFEPFFSTKPPGEGSGLGLSVVHGIALAHDAAIRVDSEPGHGCAIRMWFHATSEPAAPPSPPAAVPRTGRGQQLLLVEDEESVRTIAARMMERLGYRVTACSLPSEALALLSASPSTWQAVLTDYSMPECTGIELAGGIHAIRQGLPVILVSGHGTLLRREELAAAGISRCLAKPFTSEQLAEALAEALPA